MMMVHGADDDDADDDGDGDGDDNDGDDDGDEAACTPPMLSQRCFVIAMTVTMMRMQDDYDDFGSSHFGSSHFGSSRFARDLCIA